MGSISSTLADLGRLIYYRIRLFYGDDIGKMNIAVQKKRRPCNFMVALSLYSILRLLN